jgi:hypothetical protein
MLLGNIVPQFDRRILSEYQDVLLRDKFGFPIDRVTALLDFIMQEGESQLGTITAETFIDEEDRKIWEILRAAPAEALITGNVARCARAGKFAAEREPPGFLTNNNRGSGLHCIICCSTDTL